MKVPGAPEPIPLGKFLDNGEDFVAACEASPESLIYFLLNVGDGDTQLILLPADPEDETPGRRALVVDVATANKLPWLLEALIDKGLLLERDDLFAVVVGTHPHDDHIGGMPQFIDRWQKYICEYWDPGYYHPTGAFVETMRVLEEHRRDIMLTQPTSGMSRFIGLIKLTALAPGIGLRNRFDSFGTNINDASVALKIEFPAARIVQEGENRGYLRLRDPWSLLLGADAQTTSWAQVTIDFPQLHPGERVELHRQLRAAMGVDRLKAQVFKVPHHASKHGVNIELVERINPRLALISSVGGSGRYHFPHPLAVEAIREAIEPSPAAGRSKDHELGLHYTSAVLNDRRRTPLGSMAIMFPPRRGADMRLWRFSDSPEERIDLDKAREFNLKRRVVARR